MSPETEGSTPEMPKVGRGQSPASRKNLRPGDWRSGTREAEASQREPKPPVDEHEQDQLADMRHVYGHPKSQDRTEGQRHCRRWMRQDLKGFMREMLALGRAKLVTDEEYPICLALDSRREGPNFPRDAIVSVLIGVEGTNKAFELLLTDDELARLQGAAASTGRSLGEEFKQRFRALKQQGWVEVGKKNREW